MDAQELRTFSVDELKGRIHQWEDELFRMRFKSQSSETKDTSLVKKLRRDIARGKTVLTEKLKGIVVERRAKPASPPDGVAVEAQSETKPTRKSTRKAPSAKKKASKE